jgi:nucleoid-associated protein YgaU
MALLKNAFMKFVGPKGTATLAMEVLAELTADPETVAQAFEVRKQADRPRPPAARSHVVVTGDWLSKLSQRYYGDMYKWPVIYEANRQIIGSNPDLIRPGQTLWIPDLPRVSAVRNGTGHKAPAGR